LRDVEIFIGYDPRERRAWDVCARSLQAHAAEPLTIRPIGRTTLGPDLYMRPTTRTVDGILFDKTSQAPMATEFAIARFFVPLVTRARRALFVDCDFLFRADVAELIAQADDRFAVQVVKHQHVPVEAEKMDGQPQTSYERKNWSSCVLWNMHHAGARDRLSFAMVNEQRGLWLHQFSWLRDQEIGELAPAWNWLEGSSDPAIDPKAVHFTRGTPDMPGYEGVPFADEWRSYLTRTEATCKPASCATV
jgi:hypothetical protein